MVRVRGSPSRAAHGGSRPPKDQYRRRPNRHAELVREDVKEQQELAVSDDRRQKLIHVRGSCIIHRIPARL
jgi:hypothetical protein